MSSAAESSQVQDSCCLMILDRGKLGCCSLSEIMPQCLRGVALNSANLAALRALQLVV